LLWANNVAVRTTAATHPIAFLRPIIVPKV
jgi:hypothetical protein